MFTKSALILSALLIVGAAATASAFEDAEFNSSDRYPFLDQSYNPAAARSMAPRHMTNSQSAKLNQDGQDAENMIADRFPFLEQGYNPVVAYSTGTTRAAGSRITKLNQDGEDIENKISDRYPVLEQTAQTAYAKSAPVARAHRSVKSVTVSQKAMLNRETSPATY